MIDIYRDIRDSYLGQQGNDFINDDAWLLLLKKFDVDNDGSLNFDELKKMIMQCKNRKTKPTDVECRFVF